MFNLHFSAGYGEYDTLEWQWRLTDSILTAQQTTRTDLFFSRWILVEHTT